jgi:hypothetical protein
LKSRSSMSEAERVGHITLECIYSSAPGMGWFVRLDFSSIGDEINVIFESGGTDIDQENRKYKLNQELNWRTVSKFLIDNYDVCIFGDYCEFNDHIDVNGVMNWMKVPISLAWIRDDSLNPKYEDAVHRLISLSDEEAQSYVDSNIPEMLEKEGMSRSDLAGGSNS